jgi:hypothetical protein
VQEPQPQLIFARGSAGKRCLRDAPPAAAPEEDFLRITSAAAPEKETLSDAPTTAGKKTFGGRLCDSTTKDVPGINQAAASKRRCLPDR